MALWTERLLATRVATDGDTQYVAPHSLGRASVSIEPVTNFESAFIE